MSRRRTLIALGWAVFAVAAFFFALHRTYSPGQLMQGHQAFKNDCSSCHEPWRGVQTASTGCIDCHGNIPKNPHFSAAVSDKDSGLIAGKHLVTFQDKLACMTCHTDHIGRSPNFAKVSGQNCSWCHQHDAISDVGAHKKKPMLLKGEAIHIFAGETDPTAGTKLFSHEDHLQTTIDKLARDKQRAQKMRPGKYKDKADAEIAALAAMLDSSGQNLKCVGCHVVKAAVDGKPEQMEFSVAGCKTAGCHSGWRDDALKLAPDAPDYAAQQNPSSPEPETIAYIAPDKFLHVEAEFAHSPGHLKANCIECHTNIEKSSAPGDSAGKRVSNCFACHAHQAAATTGSVASAQPGGILGVSVAIAGDEGATNAGKVTACADCHLFHTYYHGVKKVRDFATKAPTSRPHPVPAIRLASYALRFTRSGGSITGIVIKPVTLTAWWMPIIAILMMCGFGFLYLKYLPQEIGVQRTHGQVAAQRSAEIPLLDDTYSSNVPGLYVVGETAGTASINLAMRSGRQAIQFIANRLKAASPAGAPDLYDVVVVGSGPAGISAGATAKAQQLRYIELEKTTAASTIRDYPRGKFVQATPLDMAEYGGLLMEGDYNKETLVKKWEEMLASLKLDINERDEVVGVEKTDYGFAVKTGAGKLYKTRYVVLAIGVRGTPRRLGVPGEAPGRVFHNLIEPEEFQNKNILVVGGGNAGAEVAQALSNPELHNKVGYSIREPVLGPPVTPENAEKIAALQTQGLLTLYPSSEVKEIKAGKVVLAPRARKGSNIELTGAPGAVVLNQAAEIDNDVVFAMLGAELPTKFMVGIGIRMVKKGK